MLDQLEFIAPRLIRVMRGSHKEYGLCCNLFAEQLCDFDRLDASPKDETLSTLIV